MKKLKEWVEAVREARAAMSSPEDDAYGAALKRRLREKRLREAESAVVDAITPDVLAAVEAVVALGEARAMAREARLTLFDRACAAPAHDCISVYNARLEAEAAEKTVAMALEELADRLAARKEGGE